MAVFRRIRDEALDALTEDAACSLGPIPTLSPSLAVTLSRLRRLARTDHELLLVGETGVGKEIYARAIHRVSGRTGPFVAINCAALPGPLIESELFGYAAGAHSTATRAKSGLIDAAEGGTLMLDEIGEMPQDFQGKLFRFLQDRLFMPIGSTVVKRADVRILAATSRLGGGQKTPALRSDLVARLGAEPIRVPPLRERPEDIGPLAAHFAADAVETVEPAAFRALSLYSWPLNIRELEKAIQRAVALVDGDLRLEHLPSTIAGALDRGAPIALRRRPRPAPPRAELEHLLRQHHGNVAEVARSLDRKWAVVWRWIGRLKLRPEQFRV
jgi:transcriptional regulator with PAS, ATPase and Fis domain